jgi:predicted dehydrogenase
LGLRVYGSEASLEWRQEQPNELVVNYLDRPAEILRLGNDYLGDDAQRVTRIPAGHPEGYLEAFANLYREAFRAIAAETAGEPLPDDLDLAGIDDGVIGMAFIEAAVASARQGAVWVSVAA